MSGTLVTRIADCRAALDAPRREGKRIGFVPTMGALHEGHLALIDRARAASDVVVVSIFVNPLQFGPAEDFAVYPRDLEGDRARAFERGADLVFAPSVEEMIPRSLLARVTMREVVDGLEGAARPGHFDGVLTIVTKLFHVVQPSVAVFGQKDAQQAAAIRRLIADLDFPIELIVAPTVRDGDGVALSSRNAALSPAERRDARALHQALHRAELLIAAGERDAGRLVSAMREVVAGAPGVELEYAAVVDPERFLPLETVRGHAVAAIAARVGKSRLIDNLPLSADG